MTLKVKVKVIQGHISTLYAKWSGLHRESSDEGPMTLRLKVKVTQGQISTIYANCSGLHAQSCHICPVTLKVKVKVIQGHISTLYAKWSGLHRESRCGVRWPWGWRSRSPKVKYRYYAQNTQTCMGSLPVYVPWLWGPYRCRPSQNGINVRKKFGTRVESGGNVDGNRPATATPTPHTDVWRSLRSRLRCKRFAPMIDI